LPYVSETLLEATPIQSAGYRYGLVELSAGRDALALDERLSADDLRTLGAGLIGQGAPPGDVRLWVDVLAAITPNTYNVSGSASAPITARASSMATPSP